MQFWQTGFWSAGFWSAGFWGDDAAITPPDFGSGGGTGGGSWPRPWTKPRPPIEDDEALYLTGLI